ncbi:MAG: ATPase [Oscillospiraceae bacterium]|jgi:sugar (pentulose or hexulose) kinase|nr:ATPase [Oscillospiraceae bacterium]
MSVLGVELGSTRIKSVIISENFRVLSSGNTNWENKLSGGYWTYSLEDVWDGLRQSISQLDGLENVSAAGLSAMMHGYLAFDRDGRLLAPFRTWRNTTTARAARELTDLFGFNIPQRWSVAHLYQAFLDGEDHVKDIACVTTLAGYVHWKLTGEKVLGIGDASGMFPIKDGAYNPEFAGKFYQKTGIDISKIFPKILLAGEAAGNLTEEGAKLLGGLIKAGTPFCPPEGDAGTGMVTTNSVVRRSGNISAGTSIFGMLVLDRPLSRVYPEIDIVTTPEGADVAMAHCNNCTGDIDAWINLFLEISPLEKSALYDFFYDRALEGANDCGGVITCNYISGEQITGLAEGRPLAARLPGADFTFANFARSLLYSSIATLKIGFDVMKAEGVKIDRLCGHGGLFKSGETGALFLASALGADVTVMESAGEGGAFGIAVLASYLGRNESLPEYLDSHVFRYNSHYTKRPDSAVSEGFGAYLKKYQALIEVEKKSVEVL